MTTPQALDQLLGRGQIDPLEVDALRREAMQSAGGNPNLVKPVAPYVIGETKQRTGELLGKGADATGARSAQ